jgi:hypothetical protein
LLIGRIPPARCKEPTDVSSTHSKSYARIASSCAVAALAWSSFASAQVAPPPPPAEPPPPPGVRAHDGFYLRGSTGFTAYSELIGHRGSDQRLSISGMGTIGELAIGGTVGRNVFGGGIWGTSVLATNVTASNGASLAAAPGDRPTLVLVGPFVDHYFEGDRGLHFQLALGFAAARGVEFDSTRMPDTSMTAYGAGITLAFGKDWFVGDQWSVGMLGRLSAAAAFDKREGTAFYHLIGASPGFAFSVTYH